jgi:hypothetical protein
VGGTLIPTLQVAIGPVILISGIGLLLLSMTNRFGRTVDRARELAREWRTMPEDRSRIETQLEVLMRRARILRTAITAASVSVLCAALLIVTIFTGALLHIGITAAVVGVLFVACMATLIASLLLFIRDVNLSLQALKMEVEATRS